MTATGTGRPMPTVAHSQSPSIHTATSVELSALLGLDDDEPSSWRDDALCAQVDNDLFFPEKGGSTRPAKSLCASCEVRQECLDYAVANQERYGIWGGLSERERRRLRIGPPGPQRGRPAESTTRQPERQRRDLKPIDHGTPRGYVTHRRRKEEACRPCLDAFNAYNKRRIADRAAKTEAAAAPAPELVTEPTPPVQSNPAPPTRAWTAGELADAVRLLASHGMSTDGIAAELQVPVARVRRARAASLRGVA